MNGQKLQIGSLRGDVVLKTLLRTMRKEYLKDFKATIDPSTFAKFKDSVLYMTHLDYFVRH